jgi:hypothetical protein
MEEKRSEQRLMCSQLVDVTRTEGGSSHKETCNLEDLSPSGCRLQMEHGLPDGAAVTIHCGELDYPGKIRYSVWTEIGFDVGVQFEHSGLWDRNVFEPEHLLDFVPPPKGK